MDTFDEALRDEAMEAEAAFWEQLPTNLHEEKIRDYLGVYGDAIDERVSALTVMARSLFDGGFLGPALAVSATALEVMIRFFCVRPMVEGAFLSELWASTLSGLIVKKSSYEHRKLLTKIFRLMQIDLETIKLSNGKVLWDTFNSKILDERNRFIHEGAEPSKKDAALGLECSTVFRRAIVGQLSERFGFTLAKTGKWAHAMHASCAPTDLEGREMRFTPRSPFFK